MNLKINAVLIATISIAVTIITSLIISKFSVAVLVVCALLLLFAGSEIAVLYFAKRHVLYRKQNFYALLAIALLAITFIVSMIDLSYVLSPLPSWTPIFGAVFLFAGNYLLTKSLISLPRHAQVEYLEQDTTDVNEIDKHGPYDIVRHPIEAAGLLLALGIPLILSSAWAFIPAGLSIVFILTHAATIDTYRFEEYSWYYDYTKKVSFLIMPLIW